MPAWLQWTFGILLALLILLVMITIHEFGHYVAGKILKFRINEFSIGFGPAIFKHTAKKSGELFAIRLFPLGGYCAFDGEDGLDEENGEGNETSDGGTMSEEDPFENFSSAPSEETEEAPAPALHKETAPPTASDAAGENQERARAAGGKFTEMAPWKRIIVLLSGAAMNYLLALLLILAMFGGFGQSLIEVRGVQVTEEFPAEYSFAAGDIMLSAEGRDLYLTTDIAQAVSGKKAGDIITVRVAAKTEEGYEETERKIMLRSDVPELSSTEVTGVWKALGIGIEEREDGRYYMLSSVSYRFGFFETVGRSFVYSFKIAGSIFRIIGELFTGKIGIDVLGGPVTTIKMTSEIATTGLRNFLEIAAYIGVNLAVFNLLPIPALDGSKIVFTLIEWIFHRPVPRKIEAVIHLVGIVLLLGFAILVDVLQFI